MPPEGRILSSGGIMFFLGRQETISPHIIMTHVLDKFKFCPVCGSKHFTINNIKSKKCQDCGFSYYLNASSATVALIVNEKNELLVVRRKNDPGKDMLDMPGGFIDMDETGEEGMAREVKEETGLEATEVTYLFSFPNTYLYSGFLVHTLDMFFKVKVKDLSHIEAMDDAAAYYWIPFPEIDIEKFAFDSIKRGLTRFLRENKV